MVKYALIITTFILVISNGFSCKETPTTIEGRGENLLIVEDVGVIDAVLRIKKPVGSLSNEVIVKQEQVGIVGNPIIVLNKMVVNPDTIIKKDFFRSIHNENKYGNKQPDSRWSNNKNNRYNEP